jgi:hypothetical protein
MPRVNIKGRINRQNFELNWKIPGESSFSPCWHADLLGLHSEHEWYNEKRRPPYLEMDIWTQAHNAMTQSKKKFPEKELCGLSPNFHIHVSVSDLYIPMIVLPILLQETMWTDPGNI